MEQGTGLKVTNFSLQVKRLINVVIAEQTIDRTNFLIFTQNKIKNPSGKGKSLCFLLQNIEKKIMLWFVGVKMRLGNRTTYNHCSRNFITFRFYASNQDCNVIITDTVCIY